MAEDKLELLSDLGGCLYTKLDPNGTWKNKLFNKLEYMGLIPRKITT